MECGKRSPRFGELPTAGENGTRWQRKSLSMAAFHEHFVPSQQFLATLSVCGYLCKNQLQKYRLHQSSRTLKQCIMHF